MRSPKNSTKDPARAKDSSSHEKPSNDSSLLPRPDTAYWGDLDSHGFAILNRARAAGLDMESLLMDAATLDMHRDLWVREPQPFVGELARLSADESAAFAMLAAEGYPRLEQERIPWAYALDALRVALDEDR